jgi:hypothetical protein
VRTENEQFITKQLEVKEMVNRALLSMTVVEVQAKEHVPQ